MGLSGRGPLRILPHCPVPWLEQDAHPPERPGKVDIQRNRQPRAETLTKEGVKKGKNDKITENDVVLLYMDSENNSFSKRSFYEYLKKLILNSLILFLLWL